MTQDSPKPEIAEPLSSFLDAGEGTAATPEKEPGNASVRPDAPAKEAIQTYDFRNPMLLSHGELRKLRLHQEESIQSMAARLSIHLRLEFSLTLADLQTVAYQKLAESWGRPAHLTLFKMEPLRGVSILEISTQLGSCMVDRLMGGPGQASSTNQEISEIEKVLLEQTVQLILDEWCGHWASLKELKPAILGYESNGSFIQGASPETIMLVVSMEAGLGECKGRIQIGVPYAAVDTLIHRFCQSTETMTNPAPSAPPLPAVGWKWNACFDDVCVPVTAEWEGLEMTARQILALKVGDVLPLDLKQAQRVNVRVANRFKFQGRPGTLDGKWAVEITRVINR